MCTSITGTYSDRLYQKDTVTITGLVRLEGGFIRAHVNQYAMPCNQAECHDVATEVIGDEGTD